MNNTHPPDSLSMVERNHLLLLYYSLSVDGMSEIFENRALSFNDLLIRDGSGIHALPASHGRQIVSVYNAIKDSEAFISGAICLRDMIIISEQDGDNNISVLSALHGRQIVAAYNVIKDSEAFISDAICLRDMIIISEQDGDTNISVLPVSFARQVAENPERLQEVRNIYVLKMP